MLKRYLLSGLAVLLGLAPAAQAQVSILQESFDAVPPPGWAQQNRSNPLGSQPWFVGNQFVFGPQASASYIAVNFASTGTLGTISNWLLSPELVLSNGATFTFWTRKATGPDFPDRLQLRLSRAGASTNVGDSEMAVGDFTTLLLDINPTLAFGGYPTAWTRYTATVRGLAATTTGRVAFRYFITNGGTGGRNSDYIGVDEVSYQPSAVVVLAPANGQRLNTVTPTFSGTASPGATVAVFVDGGGIGSTTATAAGTFSLPQPTALAEGSHAVSATSTVSGTFVSSDINTFVVDLTAPTATISSSTPSPVRSASYPVTVTFSEAVTGFTAADVVVGNGTLRHFSGSGAVYTFDVAPTNFSAGGTRVSFGAGVAQDAAGNPNQAPPPLFRTLAPLPAAVTWTGAQSRDWNTPANWEPAFVPTRSIAAVIYGGPPNQPLVGTELECADLRLENGAALLLAASNAVTQVMLTVHGTLTLAGGSTFEQQAESQLYVADDFINDGATLTLDPSSELGISAVPGRPTRLHTLGGAAATILQNLTLAERSPSGDAEVLALQSPLQLRRQVVLVHGSELKSDGRLTLLSDAAGTGMVVLDGAGTGKLGTISGSAAVQRHIAGPNRGAGYRHYGSPVQAAPVGALATAGFAPVLTPAYNTAADPRLVRPFPNFFGYEEARSASTTFATALSAFERGFFVPTATDVLTPGRGYDLNIDADVTLTFAGVLNEAPITLGGLTRQPGSASAHTGWHLLGNPYAAPISWQTVAKDAGTTGIDAAAYVFRSTSQYRGSYISLVNGISSDGSATNDNLAVGQGFFVRASMAGTAGQVRFSNAARATVYDSPRFQRGTPEARPLVQLDLVSPDHSREAIVAYFEAGATAGFDSKFDAYKLPASGTASLALSSTSQLSINGLAAASLAPGAPEIRLPLTVTVPATGTYRFEAPRLLNLPAGTKAYLLDAQSGNRHDLSTTTAYSFQMNAAFAGARFTLLLSSQQVLGSAPIALATQVLLYPSPARGQVQLELPAWLRQQATTAVLFNHLGQPVRRYELRPAPGLQLLALAGLATGVYALHLSTPEGTISKRLVVQ